MNSIVTLPVVILGVLAVGFIAWWLIGDYIDHRRARRAHAKMIANALLEEMVDAGLLIRVGTSPSGDIKYMKNPAVTDHEWDAIALANGWTR